MKNRGILITLATILFLITSLTIVSGFYEDFEHGMPENTLKLQQPVINGSLQWLEPSDKWGIENGRLKATDFLNKSSGALVFVFADQEYDTHYVFTALVDRPEYAWRVDGVGLVVGFDEKEKSYWQFSTSDTQWWFSKHVPGASMYGIRGSLNPTYNTTAPHTLQISVYPDYANLSINGIFLYSYNYKKIDPGAIGFYVWDSSGSNDPEFGGVSYFDDARVYGADEDNDGIPNDKDNCPNTIREQIVYGCSCNQILELKPGKNKGELKKGCSKGTIKTFTKQIGWAKDLF